MPSRRGSYRRRRRGRGQRDLRQHRSGIDFRPAPRPDRRRHDDSREPDRHERRRNRERPERLARHPHPRVRRQRAGDGHDDRRHRRRRGQHDRLQRPRRRRHRLHDRATPSTCATRSAATRSTRTARRSDPTSASTSRDLPEQRDRERPARRRRGRRTDSRTSRCSRPHHRRRPTIIEGSSQRHAEHVLHDRSVLERGLRRERPRGGRAFIGTGRRAHDRWRRRHVLRELLGEPTDRRVLTADGDRPSAATRPSSRRARRRSGSGPQPGPTFTVNTTEDAAPADAGCSTADCTLREAIEAANAQSGSNDIILNIPGAGVRTIAPATLLPTITDPVSISADPSNVDVGRAAVPPAGRGARFRPGRRRPHVRHPRDATRARSRASPSPDGPPGTLSQSEPGASPVTVTGTLVGPTRPSRPASETTAASGSAMRRPSAAPMWPTATRSSRATSPGSTPTARARSSRATSSAWARGTANGNGEGVRVSASNVLIGGTATNAGNLIEANGVGVKVFSGSGVTIRRNTLAVNSGIGIDLGSFVEFNGVTPNDPPANLDADTGPNGLQNFPVLSAASTTQVTGALTRQRTRRSRSTSTRMTPATRRAATARARHRSPRSTSSPTTSAMSRSASRSRSAPATS